MAKTSSKPKKTSKPVKYNPKKHIVPMEERRYMEALDESENIVMQFIEEQIGSKRFEELENASMDGKSNDLKDVAWSIIENIASLFKTPQEQYEYSPYNLGNGDYQPSKNFYHPNNFDEPLGVIDDQ